MLADAWTLLMLTLLETVLGIDNLIFISLAIDKAPKYLKERARFIGLGLALLMRLVTLFFISLTLSMQKPIFYVASLGISVKDLLMIVGGLFLTIKSVMELLNDIFSYKKNIKKVNIKSLKSQFSVVVLQIILIDLVFSIDSILTAIALIHNIMIISIAFIFSMLSMLFLSNYTSKLIKSAPRLKIIAILFISFVGIHLILNGLHIHFPKSSLYSSFVFALLVEVISSFKKRGSFEIL